MQELLKTLLPENSENSFYSRAAASLMMVLVGVVLQQTIVSLLDSSFMLAMHFGIFGYHGTFLKSLNTFWSFLIFRFKNLILQKIDF